jgi:alkyldihydroxyacetonephosphate synthase
MKKYGSVLFPNFEIGTKFMEEVGRSGIRPASIRLMDNI